MSLQCVDAPVSAGTMRVTQWGNPAYPTVVLLHGFMQSGQSWQRVAEDLARDFWVLAPDLPGHGSTCVSEDAADYSLANTARMVVEAVDWCAHTAEAHHPHAESNQSSRHAEAATVAGLPHPRTKHRANGPLSTNTFYVVGYSLGGRVAAYLVRDFPNRLCGCVLESAGLGTHKPRVSVTGITSLPRFVDEWEQLPLFASQQKLPEQVKTQQRLARLRNDPHKLNLSLRFAGQHTMENLADAVVSASVPLCYLAGSLDVTYTGVARSLPSVPHLQVTVLEGLGHNIHLEDPARFCTYVRAFLTK